VWNFTFDNSSTRLASICKDETWKLFDLNINYELNEEPICVLSSNYECFAVSPLIAITKHATNVAVASGSTIQLFLGTGLLKMKIENIFTEHITSIAFDSSCLRLFVAGDSLVRVFHNFLSYNEKIKELNENLKNHNMTKIDRIYLSKQLEVYENVFEKILI
jgi:WD40 repeat protein